MLSVACLHFILFIRNCCIGARNEAARDAALAGSRAPGGAGGPGHDRGGNMYSLLQPHVHSCTLL